MATYSRRKIAVTSKQAKRKVQAGHGQTKPAKPQTWDLEKSVQGLQPVTSHGCDIFMRLLVYKNLPLLTFEFQLEGQQLRNMTREKCINRVKQEKNYIGDAKICVLLFLPGYRSCACQAFDVCTALNQPLGVQMPVEH